MKLIPTLAALILSATAAQAEVECFYIGDNLYMSSPSGMVGLGVNTSWVIQEKGVKIYSGGGSRSFFADQMEMAGIDVSTPRRILESCHALAKQES